MKYIFLALLTLPAFIAPIHAQHLERKIIISNIDSNIRQAKEIRFDEKGNYLVRIEKSDTAAYFITASDTTGPLTRKSYGQIETLRDALTKTKTWYLVNQPAIFGPVAGKDLITFQYPLSYDKRFIAVPELSGSRINYYVNGRKIIDIDTLIIPRHWEKPVNGVLELKAQKISSEYDRWIQFSDSGKYIYYVFDEGCYKLFAGNKLIDTTDYMYSNLCINDKGDYLYGKYENCKLQDSVKYNYIIHTSTRSFCLNGEPYKSRLKNNKGYFIEGRNKVLIVNDHLFENMDNYENLQVVDSKNFLFTYTKDSIPHLVVNAVDYRMNYEEIYNPEMDAKGNFSVYGKRNYYLYKFVNGNEDPHPISRYGVRAVPLYISPAGTSTHLFITDDSFYVYRNNRRLLTAYNNQTDTINFFPVHYFFSPTYKQMIDVSEQEPLKYLQVNDTGYLIYKGVLSQPMMPFKQQTFRDQKQAGEIVLGDLTDNGFFVIQKTSEGQYFLNINNQTYKKLDSFSHIYSSYAWFNDNELIFYGLEENNLVQIKIRY